MKNNILIDIENVSYSYEKTAVLKNINLKVNEGDFLGLVGPNAGGKTTLLKLILGLINPLSGKISVLEKKPKDSSSSLGYVAQYPSFPRDFPITVEQVVSLGRIGIRDKSSSLFGRHKTTKVDKQAILQALQEVEAEKLAQRQIGSLSGGQLQRILLARALVSEPKILILDEPTANIDQRMEGEIFDLLKNLNKRLTILVVTHDISFVSSYVNRVACINETLVCHETNSIDGSVIKQLYGENVRMVSHEH